jgi:hypothetical protein
VPYGHWKTVTFIAALRWDRINASLVFDHPIIYTSFTQWTEERHCPVFCPGDIIITTTSPAAISSLAGPPSRPQEQGCCSCRPTSPDLNLIEQVLAKLKHLLCKSADCTQEATWRRIGSLLDAFSPKECAN